MKKRIAAVLLLNFAWCTQAQLSVPISDAQAQAELSRIQRAKEEIELRSASAVTICYQRFAVNDCLGEVRSGKRASLDVLRREEIELNDAKRKTRELERAQQAQGRNSPEALQVEANKKESAKVEHQERLERVQQKKIEASKRDMQVSPTTKQRESSASTPQSRAQAQKEFEEKQSIARERKAQRDKAQAESSNKAANPLPARP